MSVLEMRDLLEDLLAKGYGNDTVLFKKEGNDFSVDFCVLENDCVYFLSGKEE